MGRIQYRLLEFHHRGIACRQLETGHWGVYDRASFGIATNQGSYTVSLPPEELLGYDLANENKLRHLSYEKQLTDTKQNYEKQITEYKQKLDGLETKLNAVSASSNLVVQGQGAPVPCNQDNGDLNAYMASVCGNRPVSGARSIGSTSGGRCGFNTYLFSCIIK